MASPIGNEASLGLGDSSFETLPQPPIDGVRIVGLIDTTRLQVYKIPEHDIHLKIGDEIPAEIEPVAPIIRLAWARHPHAQGRFKVFLERNRFQTDDEDPFLGQTAGSTRSEKGFAHLDEEGTINVSDCHTTVFYPTKEDGQPDLVHPWQPLPGQIVEFDANVWHSPEYNLKEDGVRNIAMVTIPNE